MLTETWIQCPYCEYNIQLRIEARAPYAKTSQQAGEIVRQADLVGLTKKLDALTKHVLGPLQEEPPTMTHEERFAAQIRAIIHGLGSHTPEQNIARYTAKTILTQFKPCSDGSRPSYRIQVYGDWKWNDIDVAGVIDLI